MESFAGGWSGTAMPRMNRSAIDAESEQHDSAGRWSPASPERSQDLRAVEGHQVAEGLAMLGKEPTVVIGPRQHEQDDGGAWVIALLESQPALECLGVGDVRLEVRKARRATVSDHRV